MPSNEPGNNLFYGWNQGEGLAAQMDANLLKIGVLLGLGVIDRDLTSPPGLPNDGDSYIIPTSATGDWSGQENKVAVYRSSLTAWEFYDPSANNANLLAYVRDENRLVVWNGTDWLQGVNFS